jgi:hypothetical protein
MFFQFAPGANGQRAGFSNPVASKLRRLARAGQARDTPRRTNAQRDLRLTTIAEVRVGRDWYESGIFHKDKA